MTSPDFEAQHPRAARTGRFADKPKHGGVGDLHHEIPALMQRGEAKQLVLDNINAYPGVSPTDYDVDAIIDEVYEHQATEDGDILYRQRDDVSVDGIRRVVWRNRLYTEREMLDRERIREYGANPDDMFGADLRNADLAGVNLSHANLVGADLSGANLSYTNLSGAQLGGSNMSGARLDGAVFVGANLHQANLTKVHGHEVDCTGANLTGARLPDARLKAPKFYGAKLDMTDFTGATLQHPNLEYTDLRNTRFVDATITGMQSNPHPNGTRVNARVQNELKKAGEEK